ncbi:hypothetical protein MHU86_24019 [Fragilaria crotonensis]|nr:hypothetical protein MHU86_24019 [Fragilaria crotonensis]
MANRQSKRCSPFLFMLTVISFILGWRLLRLSVLPEMQPTGETMGTETKSYMMFTSSPPAFVDEVVSCLRSETCHILYHHVQKTGGSSVASRLFPLVEQREYNSNEWCCNEKLLDRFRLHPREYCSRKLSVYEVKAPQYHEIMETCKHLHPSHYYLSLISVREPIQRTLSMIHHQCNKNFDHKNAIEQSICSNCTYTPESAWFWDQFTTQTNTIYVELLEMVQNETRQRLLHHRPTKLTWLFLDNSMIDPFLELFKLTMQVNLTYGKSNKENTHVCNFGMTSSMMKDLRRSQMIYASLVGGYMPEHGTRYSQSSSAVQ